MVQSVGIISSKMVTICQTCGDQGYHEALVYCSKCKVSAQHRYCIDTLKVFFIEDITWSCEECDPRMEKLSIPAQVCTSLSGVSDSDKLENDIKHQVTELEKKHMEGTDLNIQPQMNDNEQKKRDITDKFDLNVSDPGFPIKIGESQCSTVGEENKNLGEEYELGLIDRDNTDEAQSGKFAKPVMVCTPEVVSHAESKPIVDPVWRGILSCCNISISNFNGLAAHLSSLACDKVLEEAMLLPEVLHADMLPRSAVWPKSFQQCGPTSWSIALYFFPESKSAEKAFDLLVENVICQDTALRVMAESAELLIYASNTLPVSYWRFKSKFYLWGVFRQKSSQVKKYVAPREELDRLKPLASESGSPISTLSNDCSFGSNAFQPHGV